MKLTAIDIFNLSLEGVWLLVLGYLGWRNLTTNKGEKDV